MSFSVQEFWRQVAESPDEQVGIKLTNGLQQFNFLINKGLNCFQVRRFIPNGQGREIKHLYKFTTHFNLVLSRLQREGYQLSWE